MKKWKLLGLLPIYTLALAFQQEEIPTYPGDPETGEHEGQPVFCQNVDTKAFKHNCSCKAMRDNDDCKKEPDEEYQSETSKCKVYCRKHACECRSDCET